MEQPPRISDDNDRERAAAPGRAGARPGWTGNRTTMVLAAGFVMIVAVAAIGVVLARHTGDAARSATGATTTAPTSSSARPTDAAGGGFGPMSADALGRPVAHPNNPAGQPLSQTPLQRGEYRCDLPPNCPPVESPAGVMWQEVKPWVLPFSTSDGPARMDGPLAVGFSRTPQGAALAAWQIVSRATSSRQNLDVVVARQTVGAPEDLARLKARRDWDATGSAPLGERPSAFRVTAYQDGFASIQYAVPASGVFTVIVLEAVWQDGDWKFRAPHIPARPQSVLTLAGWTQW
ncbi:hypothetical protein [Nocardia terpenica]|uniref:DUF8175 domain-containing protein n=1 Tax=Nocardia terpenica TaxID=455432 RepID=A0A6G9ZE09_9NOCA|nr:hypothetical protein [Nocardia terpenica]QIS23641.1 hypothetical protein F6W96_40610 [Nocardia terpenica]